MIFERVNIERIGEEWKERKNRGRQRERAVVGSCHVFLTLRERMKKKEKE